MRRDRRAPDTSFLKWDWTAVPMYWGAVVVKCILKEQIVQAQ